MNMDAQQFEESLNAALAQDNNNKTRRRVTERIERQFAQLDERHSARVARDINKTEKETT